jgi:multiple sugar transport system substrate-binding protein
MVSRKDKRPGQFPQGSVTRRDFVKTAGVAGLAAATGTGLGLFGGRAPAFAQSRTLHVLAWSHFIKEADALMRNELVPEFHKATGIKVTYETINANDLNARATAAVESGTGPDVFQLIWNQPHLYANGLENHASLAAELGVDKQYAFQQEAARVNGVLRGVPFYGIGNGVAYRKDIFQEVGINKPPDTWDEYLEAGAKLKGFGMPVGQTLGHTFGDAPTFAYPLLWSFGGQEVDENGKVAINSSGTHAACEFLQEFWSKACDESGLAWDDSSNNRAFFAETIAATLNGASIYFVARYNPKKAPPGLADKIGHFLNPRGPKGRYHSILPFTHSIAQYSKNKDAAKDFVRFLMSKDIYEKYILVQKGYGLGATPDWENHPFWKQDAAVEPYRLNAKFGRNFGWPGPFDRKAAEVQAKYIIIDLFARVAKGDSSKSSIAQAEHELKNVYERA